MKISKGEAAVILLTVCFLTFSAGWFFRGRTLAQPLRVETQRPAEPALPAPAPSEEKVDLNTATLEQLQTLPGIGEKRAAAILADREANGPFQSPEDLARVPGIGQETLKGLLDYITTGE